MKKLLYSSIMLVIIIMLTGCRNDDLHTALIDYDGKGVASFTLTSDPKTEIKNIHLYCFNGSKTSLVEYKFYSSYEDFRSDLIYLKPSGYIFVAIANAGEDFSIPESVVSSDYSNLLFSDLLDYAGNELEVAYPNMYIGETEATIVGGSSLRVNIECFKGVSGLNISTLKLELTYPPKSNLINNVDVSTETRSANLEYTRRIVVEVRRPSGIMVRRDIYTFDDISDRTYVINVKLQQDMYEVLIWSDYIPNFGDEPLDHLYVTSSLYQVKLLEISYNEHNKSPYRDAFYISSSIDLATAELTKKFVLKTLMSEHEIVATDVEKYNLNKNNLGNPDIEDLHITIRYSSLFDFNIESGLFYPNYTFEDRSYTSTASKVDDRMATLSNDYLFTPSLLTKAYSAILTITDKYGKKITEVGVLLETKRNYKTIIRGAFLTAGVNKDGVHIDPNWDDEIIQEL